jgi:hypothetical protein
MYPTHGKYPDPQAGITFTYCITPGTTPRRYHDPPARFLTHLVHYTGTTPMASTMALNQVPHSPGTPHPASILAVSQVPNPLIHHTRYHTHGMYHDPTAHLVHQVPHPGNTMTPQQGTTLTWYITQVPRPASTMKTSQVPSLLVHHTWYHNKEVP